MKWRAGEAPIYYYVFDLLQAAGKSLTGLPVERRKELLATLCQEAGGSDSVFGRDRRRPGRCSCGK